MASGSSGRTGSGSKGFDFGTDDVLCSYDDFGNQETSRGNRTDPAKRRPLVDVDNQQDEAVFKEVIATVERTMKKYADNLLRFLEGISGRLSQLEACCHNLELSVGELRSDLTRDHKETDMKLRSLEKHLQEVHRSVQILRDKQELADAQKELAKLQLLQKDSMNASHSHHSEDRVPSSTSELKPHDSMEEPQSQLALALPRQAALPTAIPVRAAEQQHQPYKEPPIQQLPPPSLPPQQPILVQSQPNAYYSQQNQMQNQLSQTQQHHQDQLQYVAQRPQPMDLSRQAPPPQPDVNQTLPQQYPSYQQQWPQQALQQFPRQAPPQEPTPQAPVRPQTPPSYPPYPHQPASSLPETFPVSMPMQVPFSGIPQSAVNRPDPAAVYGYGGPRRTVPQQHNIQRQPPPQTSQGTFAAHGSDSYPGATPNTPQPNMSGYMMYDTNSGRPLPPHFQQGGYPTMLQNPQPPAGSSPAHHPSQQLMRNHPYSELIEKAVSMGYTRDQVANAVFRIEESGQPLDFNVLLDRLNAPPSGTAQRVWSG